MEGQLPCLENGNHPNTVSLDHLLQETPGGPRAQVAQTPATEQDTGQKATTASSFLSIRQARERPCVSSHQALHIGRENTVKELEKPQ